MAKTWIEVALNGPWGRALQPRIPVTVDEIVAEGLACARAGASIVHFHAYNEATGKQEDHWETYARVIEGLRAGADVIAYPTIPLAGSGLSSHEPAAARDRFRHIDELGRRGLIEWAVVDPGTVNFTRFELLGEGDAGFVYLNPGEHIREGLRLAREHGLRPSYAIYEPGFTRLGAALARVEKLSVSPVYRFMFSDEFAWGFPPQPYALDAHLTLLDWSAPGAPWMIAGLGVDITGLIGVAAARGGHVRVGLEDACFGTSASNLELVERAARRVLASGGEPATPGEVRTALVRVDATARASDRAREGCSVPAFGGADRV
jgi:uncharacterized protein (DUF849 family)